MFQRKKQDKIPEEKLSEVEIGNLSNKEFKVMIVKINELRRRMDEQSEKLEVFNKEKIKIRTKQRWRIQ